MLSFYERIADQGPGWFRQTPAPELAEADWMIGDWETGAHIYAAGTVEARDSARTQRMRCSRILNGHVLKFGSPDGDEHGEELHFMLVDPYDKAWVVVDLEPNVVHAVQRTAAWRGDVLEFEGPVRIFDDVATWRHRIRKIDNDEWRWENDELQDDGTWRPIDYHWYRRITP